MIPILRIQLLGGFQLISGDTPITTVELPRLQSLLAYLLLHRSAPIARQQLAFLLWPDSAEGQARSNLRTLVTRLRGALPHADAFLSIDTHSLQWQPDAPWTLDVADFEQALALAEQAGNQVAARVALEQAAEVYRGDLLPGCYDDWVLPERERLQQLFLAALEQLLQLHEQQHEYPAAIQVAQRLLRHDPLAEATYQHLMRLHALNGDRASALRAYQTCVTVLRRELDVEPSPATRATYERLAHEAPPAQPALAPAGQREHTLPIPLTSFVGRVRERAEVARLLGTTRLLTLTGAGGSGKTRLALTVAADRATAYADGVALVELAALADPALVPQAVAAALGLHEESQRSPTAALAEALRARQMLLVLDNCEHLIGACAQLVQALLGACPGLQVLATSRESLGLAGETTWLVPSLSLPDLRRLPPDGASMVGALLASEAVSLFVERAAAALPTFALTPDNAIAVAQVCRRLDGIPLALELAAARVKILTVAQLAARLDDCFRLLVAGSRTALPRQQTLRAAIDWSYDLLSEQERALFQRLAVFAGGWTIEAVEMVCAGDGIQAEDVLGLLAQLVDKSLVEVETPSGGEARYRLLETMRQYSWERLRAAGDADAVQRRHAQFFVALAELAEPELYGPAQLIWLDRLEAEHDNLRAALEWALSEDADGRTELALRLAGSLARFWHGHAHLAEGLRWLERALLGGGAPHLRAKGFGTAGWLARNQGDYRRAAVLLHESLALCRELADQQGIADTLDSLGDVAWDQGELAQAVGFYEESLGLFRGLGEQQRIGLSIGSLGRVLVDQGEYARATELFNESLALLRRLNDQRGIAMSLYGLGRAALEQGDAEQATHLLAESLTLFHRLGNTYESAECVEELAWAAAALGQPLQAPRLLGAITALRDSEGITLRPVDRARYERLLAMVRAQVDAAVFATAWAEGRALSLEQAIGEALQNRRTTETKIKDRR
jgi:predicted ATPase/DNA-binding SARP family transcriptional activator